MNGVFLHSLTLSLSGTSALILALRGVEGVAERDTQSVVAARLALEETVGPAVHSNILNTALEHVADGSTQTEGVILQPALLSNFE